MQPAACFIETCRVDPLSPSIDGALVVNVGRSREEVAAELSQYAQSSEGAIEVAHAGPRIEYRLKGDGAGVPLRWYLEGNYLIVALGKESPEAVAKRMAGKEPGWLTAIDKDLPVERLAVVMHLECKPLLAGLGLDNAQGQEVMKTIGGDHLRRPDIGHRLGRRGFRQPAPGGTGPRGGVAAAPGNQSPLEGRRPGDDSGRCHVGLRGPRRSAATAGGTPLAGEERGATRRDGAGVVLRRDAAGQREARRGGRGSRGRQDA